MNAMGSRYAWSVLILAAALLLPSAGLDAQSKSEDKSDGLSYSRPSLELMSPVKAKAGETLQDLAKRVGADPIELAKINGLLPTSSLGAGRIVKVPGRLATCKKSLQDSPEVRGLKVGMTKESFLALLDPQLRSSIITLGWAYPFHFTNRAKFEGVSRIQVDFHQDRVSQLTVIYSPEIDWDDDAEFAEMLSTQFGLPAAAWTVVADQYRMHCGDFVISAKINQLELLDLTAKKNQAELERLETERKKKAFKP